MENLNEAGGIPEGLTSEEALRLKNEGKSNISTEKLGKSTWKIVRENLFTYFNLIWALIAVVLIACESYTNLTFLVIVGANTAIAIIQELKAKATVEKLSLTTDPRATVIRDGELTVISASDIVLGDVMLIEMGKQVLADAKVVSGIAEANESMLTGEADAIKKQEGDRVLAGSFLVSGSIYAKVNRVGKNTYIHKLEKAAKSFKAPSSNLFRDLTRLIKSIGVFMVPLALVLAVCNYISYRDVTEAVIKTCGSLTAMIPAGIYLLVTVTLTLSVVTLSKKKTLVQDMYSIEMLAAADVLCLDKTGTITDGTMQVTEYHILDGTDDLEFRQLMAHIEGTERSINNTSRALCEYFGKDVTSKVIIKKIPFSSERKFSAVQIEEIGGYSVGAPHFVPCPVSKEMDDIIEMHAKEGKRVILVARHGDIEEEGRPLALIAISDRIRPGAVDTIKKFQEQGVTLKVISGDHAATVSTIAKNVGIYNADKYISCDTISDTELIEAAEEYTVFGRVTPEQKVLLVKTLQSNGHTVAMTGDGVNDTLALKESNCAIAMADGSEVARKISQIVLLNSDFSTLPDVVREGRRCINNVRQSAVLYLMKTIFSILVSLISIVTMSGYPFDPKNLFFLELLVIGLASVALALEPNNKRIEGSFLERVIIKSIPNAIAMFVPVLALMILEKFRGLSLTLASRNSMSMIMVTIVGFINLIFLCRPFTKWRLAVVGAVGALLGAIATVSVYLLGDMFAILPAFDHKTVLFFVTLGSVGFVILMQFFRGSIEALVERRFKEKPLFSDEEKHGIFAFKKAKTDDHTEEPAEDADPAED